jgi:nitrogen regulatory protein P-II 1
MHIILRIYYTLSLSPCPKVTIALKRLDIIIPHERLQEVNDILHKNKVGGMTFYDIKGRGRSKREPVSVGRGIKRYVPEFASRIKIEVIVADSLAKPIIDDIINVIGTGSDYDGKIFFYDVAEAYDIGTKETSDSAL